MNVGGYGFKREDGGATPIRPKPSMDDEHAQVDGPMGKCIPIGVIIEASRWSGGPDVSGQYLDR